MTFEKGLRILILVLGISLLVTAQFRRQSSRRSGSNRGRLPGGGGGFGFNTRAPAPTTTQFRPKSLEEVSRISRITSKNDAIMYMAQLGYLPYSTFYYGERAVSGSVLQRRTMEFQRIAGIPQTGTIDSQTLQAMNSPRCGNSDSLLLPQLGHRSVPKSGYKWHKSQLTYKIGAYTTDLSRSQVDAVFRDAFQLWATTTSLSFRQVSGSDRADIIITFASDDHSDTKPFDGPSKVSMHAFPPENSAIHLDDGETWTIQSTGGSNLMQAAVHGIGHALGLEHAEMPDSVMHPYFRPGSTSIELTAADSEAIWSLYGRAQTTTTTTATTLFSTRSTRLTLPPNSGSEDQTSAAGTVVSGANPCRIRRWDGITTAGDGKTYLFTKDKYYIANGNFPASKIAYNKTADWPLSPKKMESSLSMENGFTLLFYDFWFDSFTPGRQRLDDEIRYTQHYFPNLPYWRMDAAWIWNHTVFASSGGQYWRLGDGCKPTSLWKGWNAPRSLRRLHAAGRYQGKLYFIQYDLAYHVNDNTGKTEYSGTVGEIFFGCGANQVDGPKEMNARSGIAELDQIKRTLNQEIQVGARFLTDPNAPTEFNGVGKPAPTFSDIARVNSNDFGNMLRESRFLRKRIQRAEDARGPL